MGKKFKKNLIRQNYTSGSKIDVLEPEFYELEPNKYYDVSNVVDWFDVYFIFQDQIIKEGDYSHEFLLNEIYDYYSGNINVPGRNFTLLDVNQDLILSKDYYIELNDDIMKGREYLLDKIDVEQNGEIQVPRTLAQFRDIQSGEIEFRNLLYKIKDHNDAEFVLGKDYYVSSSVIHDFNFGYEYDGYAGFNTNDPNIVLFNDSIILFGDNYDIENNLAYPIQYFEDTHLNGKTNLKIWKDNIFKFGRYYTVEINLYVPAISSEFFNWISNEPFLTNDHYDLKYIYDLGYTSGNYNYLIYFLSGARRAGLFSGLYMDLSQVNLYGKTHHKTGDMNQTFEAKHILNVNPNYTKDSSLILSTQEFSTVGIKQVKVVEHQLLRTSQTPVIINSIDFAAGNTNLYINELADFTPHINYDGYIGVAGSGINQYISEVIWDFGDGTSTSPYFHTSHQYATSGQFTVSLTIKDFNGNVFTQTHENYITVQELIGDINFEGVPLLGPLPLTVQFNAISSGDVDVWEWTVEPGIVLHGSSVSHVYNSQGLYNVTLRGYNNNYNLIEEKTKNNYINVYQRIVADFSADNIVGVAPLIDVHFFDRSVPTATSWNWEFGDGETSTAQHPTHTYDTGGSYDVKLSVSNQYSNDDIVKLNFINVLGPVNIYEEDFTGDYSGWLNIFGGPFSYTLSISFWDILNDKLVVVEKDDPLGLFTADLMLPTMPSSLTPGMYKLSFKMSSYTGGKVSVKLRYVDDPGGASILSTAYANSIGKFEIVREIYETINANKSFIYVDSYSAGELEVGSAIDWIKLDRMEIPST